MNKAEKIMLYILPIGISLQYMVFSIILHDNPIVKYWKELIVILYLVLLIPKMFEFKKRNVSMLNVKVGSWSLFYFLFLISLVISTVLFTENLSTAFFVIRRYILPIFIFIIARNLSISSEDIFNFFSYIFKFFGWICMWGIFQAYILGDQFLINLGYPVKYAGRLKDSFYFGGFGSWQRVVSTFSNTNVFGATLGLILVVVLINREFIKVKYYNFLLGIYFLTLLLTFSRSNWLSVGLIIVLVIIKKRGILSKISILLVGVIVTLVFANVLFGINVFDILVQYIESTVTLEDNSAAGRKGIWLEAFSYFKNSPFGIGLGRVGTVSDVVSVEHDRIMGESSYLAVLLDTGIQGFIGYYGMIVSILLGFYNRMKRYKSLLYKNINFTGVCLTIYVLIMFIFSNHIYDMEITVFYFLFTGLLSNKKIYEKEKYGFIQEAI
ncbi:O-antigen ligase family protein [Enterococcus sp. DIV0242_7C1]|uniref:O-antigen ligase-related domain-containing protein n=1 Tax=Candidatus Enterococcus dunnyi TaxID=1834192 RepID=A0AAQ3W6E0_9ENTE|nr:O-antigen ligase family protein [Enterococcus sp. DIV0242_7C1]MBO0471096.1 O-antigen ligase family protein [Enterococcus sp. DIV0242_7C1]